MEEPKFTVRAVDFEEKSLQEVETELVEQHQKEVAEATSDIPTEAQQETVDASLQEGSVTTEAPQNIEIDDNVILSHIKNKYNREVSSIDELIQERAVQDELESDVAAFQKYKRETGRGIEDFVKLNRDLSQADPERLLADYYRDHGDDDEDVEYRLSKFSYDEDLDSEDEIRERKLSKKQELKKAIKYFEDLKEQYKVPLESRESFVPQEEKEAYEAFQAYKRNQSSELEEQTKKSEFFQKKTNELFSNNFDGFRFNVDDDTKIVFKPGEAKDIMAKQSNIVNFINNFLDDNGYLRDAEQFHKAIAMAMDPDKTARFFYEKGKADAVTNFDRESKNIDMRSSPTPTPREGGFQVKVIEDGYEGRLKIRKR